MALFLSGFFYNTDAWIQWVGIIFLLPWAAPSLPSIFSIRWMFNSEWGMINNVLFRLFGIDGPLWLVNPTLAFFGHPDPHLEIPTLLDPHPSRRAHGYPERPLRSRQRGWGNPASGFPFYHLRFFRQIRLGFIAVLVIVWTCLPIYHMIMLSLTPQTAAFAGRLWPDNPSLENYRSALTRGHPFLAHYWEQLLNSVLVALTTCALVLFIASMTSFVLGRLKPRWAPMISNMALFTYRVMGQYGILNHPWSLILALVAFATPYAIWVMRQYAESVPYELDESARVDGATVPQIFWHIYIPLIAPSLVAIGTYALLLAWNEYLYAFLFLSSEAKLTVPVVLGHFTTSDDAPWSLMMASAVIYALPPIALYYSVRRFMVTGLTAGSVKS